MEQNPKPKVPNGSTDKNVKTVAAPNIGDVPSLSNGSVENQASGSLSTQNGGSAQTSMANNKDEAGDSKIVVEDPFDNERRQILFNAINQLQVCNFHANLDIPEARADSPDITKAIPR